MNTYKSKQIQMMIYLRKTIETYDAFILIISAFDYDVTYYPQVLLEGCLYKLVEWILQMLHYNKINISEGFDFNKTSASTKHFFLSLFLFCKRVYTSVICIHKLS